MNEDLFKMLPNGRTKKLVTSTKRKKQIIKICQRNLWLKFGGVMFQDDPFAELDYKFSFHRCESVNELIETFKHGNWAIRQCFLYKNLAFINQDNGGDEWLTIKNDYAFESISCGLIIERSGPVTFRLLIDRLLRATKRQCLKLEY